MTPRTGQITLLAFAAAATITARLGGAESAQAIGVAILAAVGFGFMLRSMASRVLSAVIAVLSAVGVWVAIGDIWGWTAAGCFLCCAGLAVFGMVRPPGGSGRATRAPEANDPWKSLDAGEDPTEKMPDVGQTR